MSTEEEGQDENQVNEDGPGVNGDLGSWFYVLGGIPSMIIFFLVMFGVALALPVGCLRHARCSKPALVG